MHTLTKFESGKTSARNVRALSRDKSWAGCWGDRPVVVERPTPTDEALVALRKLPETATLRDVIEAVLGERPVGHSQTYANVVITQRALGRLAELAAGRSFAPWEPAP